MKYQETINSATIEQAIEWNNTQEQFTYCIDTIGVSANSLASDKLVDQLESHFEALLHINDISIKQ